MDWYEQEIRSLEQTLNGGAASGDPIAFYGGSSIRMWATLSRDLGTSRIVNVGFGGATLDACVHFFERLVPPLRPTALVVYAGDNDIGDGASPSEVLARFLRLAALVDRHLALIPFGFVSIKPSPARLSLLDAIAAANEAIQREVARRPRTFYVDVFTPMLTLAGEPRAELFLEDGLHLGSAGYALWSRVLNLQRHRFVTPSR